MDNYATKAHMARVIVRALYNLRQLPAVDDRRVVRRVRKGTVESLSRDYALAVAALKSVEIQP